MEARNRKYPPKDLDIDEGNLNEIPTTMPLLRYFQHDDMLPNVSWHGT